VSSTAATPHTPTLSLHDALPIFRSQIAITTVDSPKGNIDGTTRAYTIYANDQLTDSKDWNDIIVAYRNGGPLRIRDIGQAVTGRSEEHTSELQSRGHLVCRLLLE